MINITYPADDTQVRPNVARLRETLAHIQAHPEDHKQAAWRCGTAACFAGHAAIIAGAQWATPWNADEDEEVPLPPGSVHLGEDGNDDGDTAYTYADVTYVRADGVRVYQFVRYYAAAHLGLNWAQASELFAGDNSVARLEYMVDMLTSDDPPDTLL